MLLKITAIILVILTNYSSYAGTIDPKTSDNKYLEHAESFECVGKLCGSYKDGSRFCASAVAISDTIILTAAHVVDNAKECYIHIDGKQILVEKFIVNKDFKFEQVGVGDIAIGFCKTPLGLKSYPELYTEDPIGKVCSISGFGITGTFITGAKKSDNKKRAGYNFTEQLYKTTIVCNASRPGEKNYTDLEFLIASGDSGGGLFIDGKLAGINSFVSTTDGNPNSTYVDESHHTDISNYIEWIQLNLKNK